MAEEKNETPEEGSESRKRGSLLDNKAVLLGVVVVVQALMAFAITQFVIVPRLSVQDAALAGKETGVATAEDKDGIIVGLEEIIVTLRGEEGRTNYLRINVAVEVSDQKVADLVINRLPQLRDIVIMTLSSKRAGDLLTPEGNMATRTEIFKRLAERLPPDSLRNIYFSDLVIQ
jgi:flagellar FliL protein